MGVLVFTLDSVDEHDRRLIRRLAGLVADILITKGMYTDRFFQARRRQPMSLSAEMQWQLLPPLMMSTPQVAIAGALEPAYNVAGDSFDYALNDDVLHLAMIDAMGHGLSAAVMATLALAPTGMPAASTSVWIVSTRPWTRRLPASSVPTGS